MSALSIILPVYNGETFIGRCIDSIIKNSYRDYELIIVDDGSTDGTPEICDTYAGLDSHITVFHNANHGVSYSRNYGIDRAKGQWIVFVDADDWIARDALGLIVKEINDADMLSFGFWSVKAEGQFEVKLPDTGSDKFSFIRRQMLQGWTVVWNSVFRKEFLDKYNLRFNEQIAIGEDFELLFKAYFHANRIAIVNRPLYYYNRINENSALHKMTERQYDDIIAAILSITRFYKEHDTFDRLEDILSWKILRAKQDYILKCGTHQKFLSIYPDSHRYILSCTTINRKIKIMMWLLTHKMGWITRLIVRLRDRLKRRK